MTQEEYTQQMEARARLTEKIKAEGVGAGAKWETIATAAMTPGRKGRGGEDARPQGQKHG